MAPGPNYITVGRNLAMELVRVTEVFSQHMDFFCCRVLAFTRFLRCTPVTQMMLPPAILIGSKLSTACRLLHWQAGAGWERRAPVSLMSFAPANTAATPQLPGLQSYCHADARLHLPAPAGCEVCAS